MRVISHVKTISPTTYKSIETFIVEYPRIIHAEMCRHRVYSRNTSSSRAMPTDSVFNTPNYIPSRLFVNCKGMTGKELASPLVSLLFRAITKLELLCLTATAYIKSKWLKVHKQHTNRYLEPYKMIREVITGTEWNNFYNLRISPHAQPEIRELAIAMRDSVPKIVFSEVHLPYGIKDDEVLGDAIKRNVATAASISYRLISDMSREKSNALYSRLLDDYHMSPFEHVAFASGDDERYANFTGWVSHRYDLEKTKDV